MQSAVNEICVILIHRKFNSRECGPRVNFEAKGLSSAFGVHRLGMQWKSYKSALFISLTEGTTKNPRETICHSVEGTDFCTPWALVWPKRVSSFFGGGILRVGVSGPICEGEKLLAVWSGLADEL